MIYSDKQYTVSKQQLSALREALAQIENRSEEPSWIKKAEIDALISQIADVEAELSDYDLLKSGQVSFTKSFALEELPKVLVQARIASGLSQTDLAERLRMKPQQVQRYEASDYMGASLARLIEISRVLGVKSSGTFEGPSQSGSSVFSWGKTDDIVWGQFPYKEMIKRKWFDVPRDADPVALVQQYFLRAAGPNFATAHHRKKMRSGNVPNEYALLAWQTRVLEKANEFCESAELAEFQLDDRLVPRLVDLTRHPDGVRLARDALADSGVVLVTEKHLPGSYLDGAAMLSTDGRPVIGLTLRYDRLDNFWFVLMHELGHVFLHLFHGLRFDFFDEENATNGDAIESEADRFALEALVPTTQWDQCLSRFALSEESVKLDAESLGIDPSIIAGRIRKERGDYTILSDLVGQGRVRKQLEGEDHAVE